MKRQREKGHPKLTTSRDLETSGFLHTIVMSFLLLVGWISACSIGGDDLNSLPAYLTSDFCQAHLDEASCVANNICQWTSIEVCPNDTDCPQGICHEIDLYLAHEAQRDYVANTKNNSTWAEIASLCASDTDCIEGEEGLCLICPLAVAALTTSKPQAVILDLMDCVNGCWDQHGYCMCNFCETYQSEYCPWKPTCRAGNPNYPWCRSCKRICKNELRACFQSCR